MKIKRNISIYFSAVCFSILMLSGCLDSGNDTQRISSIEFGFRVDAGQNVYNFDSTLVSGSDSLSIKKVRFVFGGDSVSVNDTTLAVISDKSLWQSFSIPNKLNRNPVRLFLSTQPATFRRFIFSVVKAPKGLVRIDNDFYSDGHNYSMIIEGTYNGANFMYKSEIGFMKIFDFGPIDLPRFNAHYLFLIKADVQDWFLKPPVGDNGFYNPSIANHSSHLDSLFAKRIMNSLHGEIYSNYSQSN